MTDIDIDIGQAPSRVVSSESALHAVTVASTWVLAAKRTHSPALVARAEQDLQAAVDGARDLGVQWGLIGSTLGIARGNAYQRYRKKLSPNDFQATESQRAHIA